MSTPDWPPPLETISSVERLSSPAPAPTWFSRWRSYPKSCFGHVAQGFLAGLCLGAPDIRLIAFAILWASSFYVYQGLSFARKVSQEGRGDTAGLDSVDFLVGLLIAFPSAFFLGIWRWL